MGPLGAAISFQCSSPSKMREYSRLHISCWTHFWTTAFTSSCDGHRSESITGLPSGVSPTGSVARFLLTVPASANAATSGGGAGELAFSRGGGGGLEVGL